MTNGRGRTLLSAATLCGAVAFIARESADAFDYEPMGARVAIALASVVIVLGLVSWMTRRIDRRPAGSRRG